MRKLLCILSTTTHAVYLRPAIIDVHLWRTLYPWVHEYVPPRIRSFLAPLFPFGHFRRIREIIHAMDTHSRHIFREKKTAFEKGDEAVVQQVGEGKDIMSILRKTYCHSGHCPKLTTMICSESKHGSVRGR